MITQESISSIIKPDICFGENIYNDYIQRLVDGLPTRDENSQTHFCVYFLPYNQKEKKVFIVLHKKSGLWISPGGHIDKGETLFEALNREIDEELGVKDFFKEEPLPFLFTTTPIENKIQPCKKHYDVWYLVPTDGSDFNVDPQEFLDTKWLTLTEAKELMKDPANIKAIEILENNQ